MLRLVRPLLPRLCTARLYLSSTSWKLQRQKTFSSSVRVDKFRSFRDIAAGLKEGLFGQVVVMTGAGVSTASGIPDFRSPGSGLYDNLHQYNLPYPEAIFDIHYFAKDPQPFCQWMQSLCQRQYKPNSAHYFVRLLQDKGLLLRSYTQNIDGLERLSGVRPDKLVEAHGTVSTSSCIVCHKEHSSQFVQETVMAGGIPRCAGPACNGLVKPDIVFFGEMLPHRFYKLYQSDLSTCDLLVVMGTSLEVHPFAGLVDIPRPSVPRLLINNERVGPFSGAKQRPNDVDLIGDIVQSVQEMVDLCSWTEDLSAFN